MNDSMAQIADRVRIVTQNRGISQGEVAVLLGLSRQTINQRFQGRLGFGAHELLVLARATGVPVSLFYPDGGSLSDSVIDRKGA